MYSRTSSDTLKLRRLITSLKETGSDLASQLENQSTTFFSGVQIVRSNNPNKIRFDSDDEEDEFDKHTESIHQKRKEAGKIDQQTNHTNNWEEEERRRQESLRKARLVQVKEEEEQQKQRLREAEELRRRQAEEQEADTQRHNHQKEV